MIDTLLEVLIDMKSNEITKYCVKQQEVVAGEQLDWNSLAACQAELLKAKEHIKNEELSDFLKKYPHYKYPGQALPNNVVKPLDKCWGRNRVYTLGGKGC
tara:strand:- start:661 stop:960 length:300 start_codon:yes stop_codon:yes gene_type:complete